VTLEAAERLAPTAESAVASTANPVENTNSGCLGGFDVDIGEGVILILFGVIVLSLFIGGGYLIYAAPAILADAALEALLAAALARRARRVATAHWAGGVIVATAPTFIATLIFAIALGVGVGMFCPDAKRLIDASECVDASK
jgi:hypothetical protein